MERAEPTTWYRPREVAELLDVLPSTVYRWMRNGDLGFFRRGTRFTRITQAQLDAFLQRYEVPPVRSTRRNR